MFQSAIGAPPVDILPGESVRVEIPVKGVFRADRIFLAGFMDEIRGAYRIRHTRLPRLDRNTTIVYSTLSRYKSKRRTVVASQQFPGGKLVREYLPETVVYEPVDPLSYIDLLNVRIGSEPQMPSSSGVAAMVFGPKALGSGLPFAPCRDNVIALDFKSHGDIKVRLFASVFGTVWS